MGRDTFMNIGFFSGYFNIASKCFFMYVMSTYFTTSRRLSDSSNRSESFSFLVRFFIRLRRIAIAI